MKIGDTIYTEDEGKGTILDINSEVLRVEFEYEGFKIIELEEVIRFETTIKEDITNTLNEMTFTGVVNGIKGSKQSRGSMFGFSDIYTKIEEMDYNSKTGNSGLSGKIIEDARNGKFISDKQSNVVAYFAKQNGLLK